MIKFTSFSLGCAARSSVVVGAARGPPWAVCEDECAAAAYTAIATTPTANAAAAIHSERALARGADFALVGGALSAARFAALFAFFGIGSCDWKKALAERRRAIKKCFILQFYKIEVPTRVPGNRSGGGNSSCYYRQLYRDYLSVSFTSSAPTLRANASLPPPPRISQCPALDGHLILRCAHRISRVVRLLLRPHRGLLRS